MSAHTPGPWRWSDQYEASGNRKTWSLISDADGYGILSCDGEENSPQGLNDEPNARLIVAAPELLEALKLAVRQNSHDMQMTGEELRQCEAAIAKATGEQP